MDLEEVVESFQPITLEDLGAVSLLNRTDTKYFFSLKDLSIVLGKVRNDYDILEIDGKRLFAYDSLYFDTPDNQLYLMHHNGRTNRIKIRIRQYVDSGLTFLEVKRKNAQGRTIKSRRPIEDIEKTLSASSKAFVDKACGNSLPLEAKIYTAFDRLTLASKQRTERITIDLNLSFRHSDRKSEMQNLVIVEVKQGNETRDSAIRKALREEGHRPSKISKYCIGRIKLDKEIKYNRFKPKVLKIRKIERHGKSTVGN